MHSDAFTDSTTDVVVAFTNAIPKPLTNAPNKMVHQAITKEDLRGDAFEACGIGATNHARELTLHNDDVLSCAYVLCSAIGYLLCLCPHQVVVVVDCKPLSKSQYPHGGGRWWSHGC